MIKGHYGECFIIHGKYDYRRSLYVGQVITENDPIKVGDNLYLTTSASDDGEYIIINPSIESIDSCMVEFNKEDQYITKSYADNTYIQYGYA